MNTHSMLKRLEKVANSFGVFLEHVDYIPYKKQAPFGNDVGLDLRKRVVYYAPRQMGVTITLLSGIIHELGHICATTKSVEKSEEYEWMGWEWLIAKKIGFTQKQWAWACGDYCINWDPPNEDLDQVETAAELSDHRRLLSQFIKERIEVAEELGCVKNGKPVMVRK